MQVAEAIWEGTLPAGSRLPAERALAEQLGISRPTLRLALRKLTDRGIIAITRGRGGGAVVRTEVVPLDLLVDDPAPEPDEIGALLEARRALEPRVALLAARSLTQEDLVKLRTLVQRQHEVLRNVQLNQQLDARFHLAIARATHNPAIWSLMKQLHLRLAVARQSMPRAAHEPRLLADINERTLRAIAQGDPGQIEHVMDEHLGWMEQVWERERARSHGAVAPDGLRPPRIPR